MPFIEFLFAIRSVNPPALKYVELYAKNLTFSKVLCKKKEKYKTKDINILIKTIIKIEAIVYLSLLQIRCNSILNRK